MLLFNNNNVDLYRAYNGVALCALNRVKHK
jgi:hypothetical protein